MTGRTQEDAWLMMFMRLSIVGIVVLAPGLAPMAALAHAGLASSTPADEAELATPPNEVVLVFGAELQPDGTGFVVTDAEGTSVGTGALDLTVADRNEVRGMVKITGPGTYAVTWSSVASDGHEEQGALTFSVAPGAESPDTALRAATDATVGVGALLLTFALALGLRRVRRMRAASALAAVALAAVLTACIGGGTADCGALPTRIELTLSADGLTPSNPAVCRGRDVTLVVTPDVDGAFHIHGYDEQVAATAVTAGVVTELDFTASRSGQFPIELHTDEATEGVSVGIFTVHEP